MINAMIKINIEEKETPVKIFINNENVRPLEVEMLITQLDVIKKKYLELIEKNIKIKFDGVD